MTVTYKEAGVDIDAGNEFVKRIVPHVKSTYTPEVLAGVGGFAAHVSLNMEGMRNPVLVSSTDGVGTKLKIAQKLNKFNSIGIDLVAMCVNDICCSGARPIFFLDYFAVEKLRPEEHSEIVRGIADGCRIAECALIGGETAELPGIYQKDDFDLAGFAVGIIDRDKIIDGLKITPGDTIVGVSSSGIHSNGYSLVRKIVDEAGLDLNAPLEDEPLGEILIKPTKIYSPLVQDLISKFEILGIAHITGGGLVENIPRILPENIKATISLDSWRRPAIFNLLQEKGGIEEPEMQRVFNLGMGMILIVKEDKAEKICEHIRSRGEKAQIIGKITGRKVEEPNIILE